MLTYEEANQTRASLFQTFTYKVEDLSAGADIAARPIGVFPSQDIYIENISILTEGAPAGIDNSNTCVVSVLNASNAIVTKTYNTATQPPSSTYESLGTLDATYRRLTAGTLLNLTVTQGATANMPAFQIIVRYRRVS